MKIFYALRSIAHLPYHESIINNLVEKEHELTIFFDRKWSRGRIAKTIENRFLNDSIRTQWIIHRSDSWRNLLFATREILSYSSYLNRDEQSKFYLKRWEQYLSSGVKRLAGHSSFIRNILASRTAQSLIRLLEETIPPDHIITDWLNKNRPDVLVVSPMNMRFSEEVEYVKAAKKLGIPTVVVVLSWDNLTTKGLFHQIPDITLVWNATQYDEAISIHRISPDGAVITGAPFFDKWFDSDPPKTSYEDFCTKVGLNPKEQLIVYLGSSANIAGDETWLVAELVKQIRAHPNKLVKNLNILARPHPANAEVYKNLTLDGLVVWPKKGALPGSKETISEFYQTLYHCQATVGINTSGMIDAIAADKPCITIMTDKYHSTQSEAVHFKHLLESEALEVAEGVAEGVEMISRILSSQDSRQEARHRFVENFVRPYGRARSAGETAAKAIELTAAGKSGTEIQTLISDKAGPREHINA